MKVFFNHFAPFFLFRLGHLCIPVSRKVYKVNALVYVIKVNGLGFSRLGAGPRQCLPVQQAVDQGGFSHI